MASRFQPARLDDSALNEVKSLEDDLGKVVVALERSATVAELSPDELDRVKGAEDRLGVVIVAYDTP